MVVARVTDSVYLLDTQALGKPSTVAVYLLRGSKIALVDCGYASSCDVILEGLSEMGVSPSEIRYLIPTHVHLDHAGGTGHLLRRMPNAQVVAHERAVPHLIDPSRLIESATSVFGEGVIRAYGLPLSIDRERVTAVGEEMHVDLGGMSVTLMHAPGHAPHQISALVEKERLLLSADAVGIVYPSVPTMIPTTPPPSFDPVKLSDTLSRMSQMDARKLLVPHYGVRDDVANVLETTRDKTEAWLSKARELRKRGLRLDQMVDDLQSEVARESGIEPNGLPDYATLSIRVSLMGLLHYLEKNP